MDASGFVRFDLGIREQANDLAARYQLHLQPHLHRNLVHVHPHVHSLTGPLSFHGEGNEIFFGEGCRFNGEIVFIESHGCVRFHGDQHLLNLQAFIYERSTLEIGRGTVAYGVRVWLSHANKLLIGDRCLFADGISIRTTDHHSIFDVDTLELLNPSADVQIENRVWVGQDVTILKGVTIGAGSIIGAKSLVNRLVPPRELWSGSPARMLRQRVSWCEPNPASADQMKAQLDELGM